MHLLKTFFLGIGLLLANSQVYAGAVIGETAAGFNLPGFSGEVRLADYRGQVVYLDFWASWCSPCRDSFPWMSRMQQKYADQGVVFVAVNVDRKRSDALDFLEKTPAAFTVAFDSKGVLAKTYDLMGMPSAFVIGRDGRILHNHIGFNPQDTTAYEQHIKQALAGQEVNHE